MTGWLNSFAAAFAAVDPRLLVAALAFHLANHLLRSLAWRNVLAAAYPDRPVPFLRIASSYAVGVALNAIAPARGGDAAKVGLARATIGGSRTATVAGTMPVLMVFDSLMGTVVVLGVAALGLAPLGLHPPAVRLPWLVAGIAVLAVVGWAIRRRVGARVRAQWTLVRRGGAILRTPGRYLRRVALPQAAAWGCRIAVVGFLLAAFGLPSSVPVAALVMVLAGASTLVPLTPGGAGTQQVMLAYAFSNAAAATTVVSFSIGMQLAVTLVNGILGLAAAMVMCGTLRPLAAIRATLRRTAEQPV